MTPFTLVAWEVPSKTPSETRYPLEEAALKAANASFAAVREIITHRGGDGVALVLHVHHLVPIV